MTTLFAKSNPRETLLKHTENCLAVYESLRERMPFLADVAQEPDFFEHLFYAVALHDFGKAATGFQQQLDGKHPWKYRHEILSTGFVVGLQVSSEVQQAIGLTILTHHKDIRTLVKAHACGSENSHGYQAWKRKVAELTPNWQALMEIQEEIREQVFRWCPTAKCLWTPVTSTDQLINGYREFIAPYWNNYEDNELTALHGTYGMLLRGCMIACDHLASAGKNEIHTALAALETHLVQHVKDKGRHFRGWQGFQKDSGKTIGNLMLSAPTGSGKTEAALLWSDKNQCHTHGKRVFYVLPYTASINAMYDRLRTLVCDERVGMLHGKATYFIYQQFADTDYHTAATSAQQAVSLTRKIYRPYKVLTPFQLLKAFFGIRGFEMQMAEMAEGLFIFDEIHAYDPHTTALILTMLKRLREDYGAKFCIMTATMPKFLKEMVNDALGGETTPVEMPPTDRNQFTRHHVRLLEGGIHETIPLITKRLSEGQRVLVVCNTVGQAQNVFKALQDKAKNAKLLHSRFILRDRERIEKQLDDADILVGTQAVEVSLDIDYGCLFSEPAPIDAMIQRFGRVNRKRQKKHCDVYICKKGGESDRYIYAPDKVERTLRAFDMVDILHESKIQNLIDEVYREGYNAEEYKEFNEAQQEFERNLQDIFPFIESRAGRDEFEKLFKSIEVVPAVYKDNYLAHVKAGEYYEAMAYVAQIQDYRFEQLRKGGRLCKDEALGQWFINVRYDETLGLRWE